MQGPIAPPYYGAPPAAPGYYGGPPAYQQQPPNYYQGTGGWGPGGYDAAPVPGGMMPPPPNRGGRGGRGGGGRGGNRKRRKPAGATTDEEGYGSISLASLQRDHRRKVAKRQQPSPWHPVPSPMPINAPPAPKLGYEQRVMGVVPPSPGPLLATPQHNWQPADHGGDMDDDAACLGAASGLDFYSSGYGLMAGDDDGEDGFNLGDSDSGSEGGGGSGGNAAAEDQHMGAAGGGDDGDGAGGGEVQQRLNRLEEENLDLREERQNLLESVSVMDRQLAALRRRLQALGEDPDAVLVGDDGGGGDAAAAAAGAADAAAAADADAQPYEVAELQDEPEGGAA